MLTIPLRDVPSQRLTVGLNGQACQLDVQQRFYGVFLNLQVNNSPVISGAKCLDRTLIVRDAYLPFVGDLVFVDQQGTQDPDYTGLGSRYLLLYLTPDEVDAETGG